MSSFVTLFVSQQQPQQNKMFMKKILTAALMIAGLQGFSQFTYDYLRAADQYFSKGDYYSATQYYEKYLGLNASKIKKKAPGYSPYTVQSKNQKGGGTSAVAVSSRQQAMYNLAESYRMLNYPSLAEPQYKKVIETAKTQFPLARFYHGTMLRSLEQYDNAATAFNDFLGEYSGNDEYSAAAKTELQNLAFIQQQLQRKDLGLYAVNKLEGNLNPGGANYAPVWLGNDRFIFTSTRNDSSVNAKNKNDNRLYAGSMDGNAVPEKWDLGQTADVQQAAASISADGNWLFLTRWSSANGKKEAMVFASKKEGGNWGAPVKVEGLHVDGYSTQQPFAMPGKLIFASNRPGGSGGFDLYEAALDANGNASAVTNLGPGINTASDEQAPSFHAPSSTLVFSSNGRIGMGGYDFYYSKWTNGGYAEPVNFGHPVNSVKDDIYFTSRGSARNILENVLISSDRSAACCLELFSLSKQKPAKRISGLVVRCDDNAPISDATVKIVDTTVNTVVTTLTTGMDGSYSFTLEEFQPLKAVASADGYADNAISFAGPQDETTNMLRNGNICLVKGFPPPIGVTEALDNIYYEFDEYKLLEVSNTTLDKLAANLMAKPNVVIEIAGHTDAKGTEAYNMELSQKRAESCVQYLISKGVNPKQLVAKGYGKTKPLASNTNEDGTDNPEGRAKNRRTEFKVLEK
jgi:OmpA-OmpF porin, OOP family